MISETDIKIVNELHKNGRATYAAIASALGINSSTVAKIIDLLIKNNVMDVRAMLNPYELGLKAGAVIAFNVQLDKHESVCSHLTRNIHVSTILSMVGKYDYFCLVHYQTWEELNHFVVREFGALEGVIDYECHFIDETVKRYHHIFGDGKEYKEKAELKDFDWKLIEQLSIDGRISNSDLANMLGTHVSTISRRISSLLEQDLIRIMSQPNPGKFGYSASAIIMAYIGLGDYEAICKEIYQLNEVFLLLKLINKPYLVIGLHTQGNDKINQVINTRILNLPGISKSEIYMRSRVIKSSYGWYLGNPVSEADAD